MRREVLREDVVALYERFANTAISIYKEKGEVAPQLICLSLGAKTAEVTHAEALSPEFVRLSYVDSQARDRLGIMIRLLLKEGSPLRVGLAQQGLPMPDVVVQISEAWIAELPTQEVENSPEPIRVSERADKKEVLLVALHSEHGSAFGMSPIENKSITYSPLSDRQIEGRFSVQSDVSRH